MRICWDWRLARVLDGDGEIVDESIWDARRSPASVAKRISRLTAGRMTDEARRLFERFPDAVPTPNYDLAPGEWPPLDADETELIQQASLLIAQEGVADAARDPDRRLEHLVRAGDELKASWTTLEARVVEWAGLFLPELDIDAERSRIPNALASASSLEDAAAVLGTVPAEAGISDSEWQALCDWSEGVVEVESRIRKVEDATRVLTLEHLPSTSALIGPLLAARLSTAAHGRMRLARLPSGTVQVLGAETSFFLHLRSGIPVPKHGHIFQHPWVCRSPRWVRGKISRMLSGKISICSRLDAFEGQPWGDSEVAEVEARVQEIRQRHPKPRRR
jgi:nucleolar protein 56